MNETSAKQIANNYKSIRFGYSIAVCADCVGSQATLLSIGIPLSVMVDEGIRIVNMLGCQAVRMRTTPKMRQNALYGFWNACSPNEP